MREIRPSGSEGGGTQPNESSLPLFVSDVPGGTKTGQRWPLSSGEACDFPVLQTLEALGWRSETLRRMVTTLLRKSGGKFPLAARLSHPRYEFGSPPWGICASESREAYFMASAPDSLKCDANRSAPT